jgi:hypothetical protein
MNSRNIVTFRPRDAAAIEPTAEERQYLEAQAGRLFREALSSAFNATFKATSRMLPTMSPDTALLIVKRGNQKPCRNDPEGVAARVRRQQQRCTAC